MAIIEQGIHVVKDKSGGTYLDFLNDMGNLVSVDILFDDENDSNVGYAIVRTFLDDTDVANKNGIKNLSEALKPGGDVTSGADIKMASKSEAADALFGGNLSLMQDFIKQKRDQYQGI